MKKILTRFGTVMLVTCSLIIVPISTYAEKDLQEIKDEREEVKKDLSEAEKEVADILIEIEENNKEIEELEETLKANEQAITEVETEIEVVQEEIDSLEEKIEERFDILKKRAKSYQKSGGDIGYLEVILGAEDFNDFISRFNAVTAITDSDAELIKKQEEDKRKVEMKLEELEKLEEELLEIEKLVTEQKDNAIQMKEDLKDKNDELNELVTKLEMKDDELATLEMNAIAETAVSVSDGDSISPGTGGAIGWPTEGGYISSHMGERWGKMHKGIDIARTDRSTSPPIYATDGGTVESAGFNNGGYGNMVIINHGNGMKTLYAHMSSIKVSSGQSVKKGQQIGVMGETGNSKGIHLHFEVHVNGSIQNPVGYLK